MILDFLNLFDPILTGGINLQNFLIVILCSIVGGFIVSIIYLFVHRNESYNFSMPITVLLLPIVVSIVLALVGNNYAGAFSLIGVFSLIRFRSEQGSVKDIAYLFLSVSIGLAMGLGYIAYGFIICGIVGLLLLLLDLISYGTPNKHLMKLKIVVPEDLNYEDVFTEILKKYTSRYQLDKVRTIDFGTMFELTYSIYAPTNFNKHELIDEIRCRNGNLNVTLTMTYKVQE